MVVGSLKRIGALALVVGLLGLNAPAANAGFTIELQSVSGTGPYTYNYTATIAPGDSIVAGSFFRVYDFFGYVDGSISAPAGWSAAVSLSNPVPPPNVFLDLGDDPAVENLLFTYTPGVGDPAVIAGAATIVNFTAQSLYDYSGNVKNFAGRARNTAGTAFVDSVGDVGVPNVPEPSAMISMGLGSLVLVLAARARRRRA